MNRSDITLYIFRMLDTLQLDFNTFYYSYRRILLDYGSSIQQIQNSQFNVYLVFAVRVKFILFTKQLDNFCHGYSYTYKVEQSRRNLKFFEFHRKCLHISCSRYSQQIYINSKFELQNGSTTFI